MPKMRREASAKSVFTPQLADECREVEDALKDGTRNSKYRLYQLEQQFQGQRLQSRDRIDAMQKKIETLKSINQNQHHKIQELASEKQGTLYGMDQMQERLRLLNSRLLTQNDLYKHGKD